jgi:arsenate reductase
MSELKVLFICIGNTCRSPMAEAMARGLGDGRVRPYSAGLNPTGRVARETLEVIEWSGYESSGLQSKHIDAVPLDEMDVIVSMIGPSGLRWLPHGLGARLETWSIRDPYGDDAEVYRAVARTIERKVRALLEELFPRELPTL